MTYFDDIFWWHYHYKYVYSPPILCAVFSFNSSCIVFFSIRWDLGISLCYTFCYLFHYVFCGLLNYNFVYHIITYFAISFIMCSVFALSDCLCFFTPLCVLCYVDALFQLVLCYVSHWETLSVFHSIVWFVFYKRFKINSSKILLALFLTIKTTHFII